MAIEAAFMVPHPPLIIPAIGKGQEKQIQNTINACHEAARMIGALRPETIVLISPHQIMYTDYFHISPGREAKGDFRQFGAGNVKMSLPYDTEFVEKLCSLAEEKDLPAGIYGERDKRLDHGTMVPLFFVNQYWEDYQLVRIGLSSLPFAAHYELGEYLKKTADALGRRTVVIGSGDLSHRLTPEGPYGYQQEGPAYDSRIMDVMERGAFGELFDFPEDFCEKAGECGHRSFLIMAGALDGRRVLARRLSYEGPFGVGYGICCYTPAETDISDPQRAFRSLYEEKISRQISQQKHSEDAYISLARKTIETYVHTGKRIPVPDDLPSEMYRRRAGVFVSIKEEGNLRGCIGTIQAVQPSIAEEIIDNAISAASRDPRFSPITPRELPRLSVSVDVLGDTEQINSPQYLDVKRYGVIVTSGSKRGLLLPNLEGVDTVEDQISIARRKAGIRESESVLLERFEVVRHEAAR